MDPLSRRCLRINTPRDSKHLLLELKEFQPDLPADRETLSKIRNVALHDRNEGAGALEFPIDLKEPSANAAIIFLEVNCRSDQWRGG